MSYADTDLPDPDVVRTFSQEPAPSFFEWLLAFCGRLYEVLSALFDLLN